MEEKRDPQTWQELLQQIVEDPKEQERIVSEADIKPITLMRWIKGISTPRTENMRALLAAIPLSSYQTFAQLIAADFPNLSSEHTGNQSMRSEPPLEFYMSVLNAYANMLPPLYPQVLRDLILQQMIKHFDPARLGLAIRIIRCVWHQSEHKVRSLQVIGGIGTPPWNRDLNQQTIFLGAESLAGIAVMKCHLAVASNQAQDPRQRHPYWEEREQSALAYPLMCKAKIAGSLLISSIQPDAFSPAHHKLIERYANLMALAFEPDTFFDLQDIALHIMPPYSYQEPLLRQVRQRTIQKVQQQYLTLSEAQEHVWQEIEEELIQLALTKLHDQQIKQE